MDERTGDHGGHWVSRFRAGWSLGLWSIHHKEREEDMELGPNDELDDGLFFKTRTIRPLEESAETTGTERAMRAEAGAPYTAQMAEEMVEHLKELGYRSDFMLTIRPVALNPQALARKVSRLLSYARERWSKHRDSEPPKEAEWFDFVIVTALCPGSHHSHAHVVLTRDLSSEEIGALRVRAKKWNMAIKISRNTTSWLAKRPNVKEHRCKIDYTISHMLQAGSELEIGEPKPESRPTPSPGAQKKVKLPKPLFKTPGKPSTRRDPRRKKTPVA